MRSTARPNSDHDIAKVLVHVGFSPDVSPGQRSCCLLSMSRLRFGGARMIGGHTRPFESTSKRGSQMRHAAMAAVFMLAGAGLTVSSGANAAAFTPAAGARIDAGDSFVLKTQGNRPVRRAAPTARRAAPAVRRAAPAVRRAPVVRRAAPAVRRAPTVVRRPGVVVRRPGVVVRPGGRAVVHVRGFRPAGFVRWHPRHLIVRPWYRRPYYGTIIGGIALGTVLAASSYYAYASAPPAPGLCWYWSDDEESQGYWDYCVDPN